MNFANSHPESVKQRFKLDFFFNTKTSAQCQIILSKTVTVYAMHQANQSVVI